MFYQIIDSGVQILSEEFGPGLGYMPKHLRQKLGLSKNAAKAAWKAARMGAFKRTNYDWTTLVVAQKGLPEVRVYVGQWQRVWARMHGR